MVSNTQNSSIHYGKKGFRVLHRQSEVILSGRNKVIWLLEENQNLLPNRLVLLCDRNIGSSIGLHMPLD